MKKKIGIIIAVILVIAIAAGVAIAAVKFKGGNKYPLDLKASFDELTVGDSILNSVAQRPDRWKESLVSNYGMDEETRDRMIKAPEEWLAFNYIIDITNPNDEQVLASALDVKDNGKNGVYISKYLDGVSIFDANSTSFICVTVFYDGNEPSLDEVAELVKGMKTEVIYSAVPEDFDAEIPEEDLYRAQVDMK